MITKIICNKFLLIVHKLKKIIKKEKKIKLIKIIKISIKFKVNY
jgi:hypothetical protein